MENNMTPEHVPYTVYEASQARSDRRFKLMWWLIVVLFIALVGTNAGWMVYESQFEDSVTVTQDTPSGNNNYIGRDGDITNGTANSNEDKTP